MIVCVGRLFVGKFQHVTAPPTLVSAMCDDYANCHNAGNKTV